ncbi:MAG: hypothetical protein CM15mP120_03570 [Pseudomonadota bacterium]|nr:MAG: hypothetical protein CM15mP120_03570 [Pseudomonadota bacterium]
MPLQKRGFMLDVLLWEQGGELEACLELRGYGLLVDDGLDHGVTLKNYMAG